MPLAEFVTDIDVSFQGGPGRHLIAASPEPQLVPSLTEAISRLPAVGYTVDPAACADPANLTGWTQVTYNCWTAPCHPAAPSAQRLWRPDPRRPATSRRVTA
ncbi:hypothetical protein GTY54_31710, partial [Streptomyces sp. SID625]|nr:hypothetical protein [Streptomyces sp. SID625]